MSELGERNELSLAHFPFGLLYESALFGGEHVLRINHPSWLDKHAVLLFCERHKIPFLDVEGFEHLPRNDDLAPLAHATNPLPGYVGFYCHTFSDYLTVRICQGRLKLPGLFRKAKAWRSGKVVLCFVLQSGKA